MLSFEEQLCQAEDVEVQLVGNEETSLIARNATELLLLNLVCDRIEEARFVWRRTLPHVRDASADLRRSWQVGACLWMRNDIAGATRLLENENEWNEDIRDIVKAVLERVRENELLLISRAYSTIELSEIANRLTLSEQQALDLCRQIDWTFDPNDGMVLPRNFIESTQDKSFSGLDKLKHVADIMTQLNT
uniref:CSN8/PSMD8/EIF3K domain-containing protein n=1 Tax=Aureoumbra lagunensis TaxID=44058 RepID=A0A7S3K5Z3_9STRA|mmetsp:Transcript_19506/g.25266  ORF Transcript_19506/g.25266 Transcript_19506/m.25266 type:complete len:191 (-) Transcript_19506:237-809(-)